MAHYCLQCCAWDPPGCRVGVGVAWNRGKGPGVGVGVDQIASTPTPKRFISICDMICLCRGDFGCTFLEIICADIVFKFCSHQGCSQRGATGTNAPARLSRVPRTSYSLMLGRRSEFSWDAYWASYSQLSSSEESGGSARPNPQAGHSGEGWVLYQNQTGPILETMGLQGH